VNKYDRFNFAPRSTKVSSWPDANAVQDQADGELGRLRDELTALKAILADRETELAKAALEAERDHVRWQESEAALSSAAQAWRADEAARLAATEEQWREQYAGALAEATARCEAAEGALAHLRDEAARERNDIVGSGLSVRRVNRETEFEPVVSATESERGHGTEKIVLRPTRIGAAETLEQGRRASWPHPIRHVFVAASLGVLAITAYFSIGPFLPQMWPSNLTAVNRGVSLIPSGAPATSPPPIPTNVAAQSMAIAVRDVNVRASPSNAAAVVSTLARGAKVATIERRGNWTLVQIEGDSRNIKPQRGWVYGSFLRDEV